jgi:hypothetical protein
MGLLSRAARMVGRGRAAAPVVPKVRGVQQIVDDIADTENQLAALRNYEIAPQPRLYGERPNPMGDAREMMIVQRQMQEFSAQKRRLLEELRAAGISVNPNTF